MHDRTPQYKIAQSESRRPGPTNIRRRFSIIKYVYLRMFAPKENPECLLENSCKYMYEKE